MSVVEKAEKAIDILRSADSTKIHELQTAAGVLGRCMGALGGHPSLMKQYMDLLPYSVHALLTLASHDSAEVRLVGDEALNRMVVGGLPFHASKINIHMQNHIDVLKSPRWLRAAFSRLCLGKNWLRPGLGKGRMHAKSLFTKIRQIINHANDTPSLILETIETNLPRILKALSPFSLKDELQDVLNALFRHASSSEASVRRSTANCIAAMCQNQESFISIVVNAAIDALWSDSPSQQSTLGWFAILKNVFQLNPIGSLSETVFSTCECLQLFQLCLTYLASTDHDHNVHNSVLECLTAILTNCGRRIKNALKQKNIPNSFLLEYRSKKKKHQRSLSSVSMMTSTMVSNSSSMMNLAEDLTCGDQNEGLIFAGALALTNLSRVPSLRTSLEDLSIKETKTPDYDNSDGNSDCNMSDNLSGHVAEGHENLNEPMVVDINDDSKSEDGLSEKNFRVKVNIGTYADNDKRIKYCARLIVSRFLLSGRYNETIPDRLTRVSVKATTMNCLAAILDIYPDAMTLYLDKDGEACLPNISGNSDMSTLSNIENSNEFILERNVCYQESFTDSSVEGSLNKSMEIKSQSSVSTGGSQICRSTAEKRDHFKGTGFESAELSSSSKDASSHLLDSKQLSGNDPKMAGSMMSNDSANNPMFASNFTIGSNVTSHDPLSTEYQYSTSGDLVSSSQDLEIKFDHFGESTTSIDNFDPLNFPLDYRKTLVNEKMDSSPKKENDPPTQSNKIANNQNKAKRTITKQNELEANPLSSKIFERSNEICDDSINPTDSSEMYSDAVENESKSDLLNDSKRYHNSGLDDGDKFHQQDPSEKEYQHMSEVFNLFGQHVDPQIRGLTRICIGNYLRSAFDVTIGDYAKWRAIGILPKTISDNLKIQLLLGIIIEGLNDDVHSCVNYSLLSLSRFFEHLTRSCQISLIPSILNSLHQVETNPYFLCKINLCRFYEKLPIIELSILLAEWSMRSDLILASLIRLLSDNDQKVRNAASDAIVSLAPSIYNPSDWNVTKRLTRNTYRHSQLLLLSVNPNTISNFLKTQVLSDLPHPLGEMHIAIRQSELQLFTNAIAEDSLKGVLAELLSHLMTSSSKNFTQGLLEALRELSSRYPPWLFPRSYADLGMFELTLQIIEYRTNTVQSCENLIAISTQLYSVEAWKAIGNHLSDQQKDSSSYNSADPWSHFGSNSMAGKADHFLKVTLKLLNIIVHLIEEVNPVVQSSKTITLPGSPVRKKSDASSHKQATAPPHDATDSLRKKQASNATNVKTANPVGHFLNDSFFLKLYENLKATYSNYKVNLDTSESVFTKFLSVILDALATQLEMMTDKEAGKISEEILKYLKVILPLKPDKTVFCVTQLMKCLFSLNMAKQYSEYNVFFPQFNDDEKSSEFQINFFEDVINSHVVTQTRSMDGSHSSRSNSVSSTDSSKWGGKILMHGRPEDSLAHDRACIAKVESFLKQKADRKLSTNKEELAKYIGLFEPIVIQALKSYTIQNDLSLQCRVLGLLNQLLTLKVNYCLLDSDQIFIGFVLKQLEFIEQHEILDSGQLVHGIMVFLVQLSAAKHHTKQLMDVPKLIQLCDGLMAGACDDECISALHPLSYLVLRRQRNLRIQQAQDAKVAAEVVFAMLQKMMHHIEIIDLVASVLLFSEDQIENNQRWSQLAADTLIVLLKQHSIPLNSQEAVLSVEKLLDCISKEVLFEQGKFEVFLKILLDKPPDQESAPLYLKERWLSTVLILLRKVVICISESDLLLCLNYLKASYISPSAVFFNVKTEIDPLNVHSVNENCANLSPDVIFVRFLFRTLTYAILEAECCQSEEFSPDSGVRALIVQLATGLACQIKQILHLTEGCSFPLLAKTAQSVLQNEQSGLNTGLYNPEENIPLSKLNSVCIKLLWKVPILTVHWSHLLIRLKFLEQKYWQKLLGYVRSSPLSADSVNTIGVQNEVLQVGCVLAYCEYFMENGLDEAIHLTWLLVNRIHLIVTYFSESVVASLVQKVNNNASASGLLLQAIAARCQNCIRDSFAINTYRILRNCHLSQSGALIFLICRILGRLQPAIAVPFAKLASDRCEHLRCQDMEEVERQLTKEDIQVALEMLQKDKIHIKFPHLISEVNSVAAMFFDLSPLDLSRDRPINPLYIQTCNVNSDWYFNQVKSRCCDTLNTRSLPGKYKSLALLLVNLNIDQATAVIESPEFDRNILCASFEIGCDTFVKSILNNLNDWQTKEDEKEIANEKDLYVKEIDHSPTSVIDSNILSIANNFAKLRKSSTEPKSTFFVPVTENKDDKDKNVILQIFENLKIEMTEETDDFVLPDMPVLLRACIATVEKLLYGITRLFPKQNRPLSQSETFSLTSNQTLDRYTKRCHQVFREKLFHQEFCIVENIVRSYLQCLEIINLILPSVPCEVHQKIIEALLPKNLVKNLSLFTIISLQYASFLIKNVEESFQGHGDVSFRSGFSCISTRSIENILLIIVSNASISLNIDLIFNDLNTEANNIKIQSGINCLYTFVKYYVKDTNPLSLRVFSSSEKDTAAPRSDVALTCYKLLTLISYWEENFYNKNSVTSRSIMPSKTAVSIERLMVALCRCDFASSFSLIPPLAWSSVDDSLLKDGLMNKLQIPIQALQDMDVLQPFIFRLNLIGWTSKKHFEEIWMGLLNALQGNGVHWAIRGMMQFLISTLPSASILGSFGHGLIQSPRERMTLSDMSMNRLKRLSLDCNTFENIFAIMNLERYSSENVSSYGQFHYQQLGLNYLKNASGMVVSIDRLVKNNLKLARRKLTLTGIDLNSCLQLLIDVINQMIHPQSPTGLGARISLLCLMANIGDLFTFPGQWECLDRQFNLMQNSSPELAPLNVISHQYIPYGLTKVNCILDKEFTDSSLILSSLSSTFAPTRQSGMHAALLCLHHYRALKRNGNTISQAANAMYVQMIVRLTESIRPHLIANARVSFYEQSLCWSILFTLVELGSTDLLTTATEFALSNPDHFCTRIIFKGILHLSHSNSTCKDLLKTTIGVLCRKMEKQSEDYLPVLFIHVFAVDAARDAPKSTLLDVSNMDPDLLLSSMERVTALYNNVRNLSTDHAKEACAVYLKYFLRATLPPVGILSRVVVEFLDMCKEAENDSSLNNGWILPMEKTGDIVFTVFESSISLPQLSTLNVWLFETLGHLLGGKISASVIPYCLLYILLCASENNYIRSFIPFAAQSLKQAITSQPCDNFRVRHRKDLTHLCRNLMSDRSTMSFVEKRLLCLASVHSNFGQQQLDKLKELCSENESLKDMFDCLTFCSKS